MLRRGYGITLRLVQIGFIDFAAQAVAVYLAATPISTVLSLCLLSGTYAMEFSPARHLSFTDFGKHRRENKFKGTCKGKVIELQGALHASFNLANTV